LQEGHRIENILAHNFKNLLRHLQKYTDDYEIIKSLKTNVNPEMSDLVHSIKCLRIIMLKKLSTAAEEE